MIFVRKIILVQTFALRLIRRKVGLVITDREKPN